LTELKRTLGLAECVFFGVGSILGAGIYTLIGKVAGMAGNLTWLAFLIASIAALFTAFSYAELSAAFPKAGGEYIYAKKAFGQKMGVFLGIIISFNGIISAATVSLGFAGYLNTLTGISMLLASLGIIILLFLVNISGIKQSSSLNIIFTIIEAAGLLLIIYVAFPSIRDVNLTELSPKGVNGLLTASVIAFFAYMGFEEIVKLAEETNNPEKTIPKALFISSAVVIVLYTLVTISAVSVTPYQQLAESASPLADIANTKFGTVGIVVISVIALFATSNTILSNMMGSSRVLFGMSKETKLLQLFSYISPKRRTPVIALTLILVITSCFALIGNIETVALITTIFIFITFIVVNLSVIVLRVNEKDINRPYRIPLNIKNIPVISVFGIILTIVLLSYNVYSFL